MMITKMNVDSSTVDWDAVEKATEVKRTYLVTDQSGKEFFKLYKPSEAKRIFSKKGWKGQIVGTLDRRH